ncbi:polysaccharide lyase family 8 super-sandwich domain-containing protein [Propionibacteriaceae bacterium Y1700]|uniref:polysaccharide lyase family 8 super-sandwich domain-containing protein n=1 Tax=Microlunatus sp. Y1700 TaxID=3418487 RepID=UPI003DA72C53
MSPAFSRRAALAGGTGLCAAAALGSLSPSPAHAADDEFDAIRERFRTQVIGPRDLDPADEDVRVRVAAYDEAADAALARVDKSVDRPGVFTDLVLRGATDSAIVTQTVAGLQTMAFAYAAPGGRHHGSAALAEVAIDGLRTLHALAYNVDQAEYDNWWDWEIGSADRLGQTLTLLYEVLPADLLEDLVAAMYHFVPDPAWMYPPDDPRHKPSTAANLAKTCQVAITSGFFKRDGDRIGQARTSFPDAIAVVTEGDGIHPDGSFLQHGIVAYNGSYGATFLMGCADVLPLLAGTSWEIDDPRVDAFHAAIDKTFVAWIDAAAISGSLRGRSVAVSSTGDLVAGRTIMTALLKLAPGVDADTAARWRGLVKGWVQACDLAVTDPTDDLPLPQIDLYREALADDVAPVVPGPEARTFPDMDRVLARRDGWQVNVAMASNRTARFEVMQRDNLHPWHQGSGMVWLTLDDHQGQYDDAFWPTVDPYRLPGTTIDTQPQDDIRGGKMDSFRGAFAEVGGCVIGDEFTSPHQRGSHAIWSGRHTSWKSDLTGRHAWFLLADSYVCLGAGITGGGDHPVQTVLENRKVPMVDSPAWTIDGQPRPGSSVDGWSATVRAEQLHLGATGGYLLLDGPQRVQLSRSDRTGRWADISERGSSTELTRGFQMAVLDHGVRPTDASYAYQVVPGVSADDVPDHSDIVVIDNSASVQAISAPREGFLGAHFHQPGTIRHGRRLVTADQPCAVAVLENPGRTRTVELSVADGSRTVRQVRVECALPSGDWQVAEQDDSVRATVADGTLTATVSTGDSRGASHRLRLTPA